jgi:3-methyladenine DNA glycosylase/8-oxoguanine DNA glycosylase
MFACGELRRILAAASQSRARSRAQQSTNVSKQRRSGHARLTPMPRRSLDLDAPIDLRLTLAVHLRGNGDPTIRLAPGHVVRATRTADGPATLELVARGARLEAEAWGLGAERILDNVPALAGLDDDQVGFVPRHHRLVFELARRHAGVRLGRTGAVFESLMPAILEQKVTGTEAWRGFRGLIRRWGEPAPGPFGLWLAPAATVIATIPYYELHPLGIDRRRADLLRRVADRAARFEEIVSMPRDDAYRRLRAMPGIGPWTAAEVALRALGDPDAVSVGDFHLPNLVAFSLAGEIRGDDARMLELLEPWRGHRARVVRLLELGGLRPPAFGPRLAPRSIAAI